MPKQTVTIEVDVPEGFELHQFSQLQLDSTFVDGDIAYERFVVRKAWQWPSWLKANYIAMDENGDWWAYHFDPVIDGERWYAGDMTTHLAPEYFDFTPPPCTDWRQSKRRRPQ